MSCEKKSFGTEIRGKVHCVRDIFFPNSHRSLSRCREEAKVTVNLSVPPVHLQIYNLQSEQMAHLLILPSSPGSALILLERFPEVK